MPMIRKPKGGQRERGRWIGGKIKVKRKKIDKPKSIEKGQRRVGEVKKMSSWRKPMKMLYLFI